MLILCIYPYYITVVCLICPHLFRIIISANIFHPTETFNKLMIYNLTITFSLYFLHTQRRSPSLFPFITDLTNYLIYTGSSASTNELLRNNKTGCIINYKLIQNNFYKTRLSPLRRFSSFFGTQKDIRAEKQKSNSARLNLIVCIREPGQVPAKNLIPNHWLIFFTKFFYSFI